jgi:hypothetical protein
MAARLQMDPADVIYLALENQATVEFVGKLRQRASPPFWLAVKGCFRRHFGPLPAMQQNPSMSLRRSSR